MEAGGRKAFSYIRREIIHVEDDECVELGVADPQQHAAATARPWHALCKK